MENFDKFENFLRSFGATRLLLKRAHDGGFLIEGLVLYALLVDGCCRIALVLKEQVEKKSGEINEIYIHQDNNAQGIAERSFYRTALEKKIISEPLFKELNKLYDIRNKFIHRFFVSEIEYSHLEIVCRRYENVYNQLYKIVYDLESEQVEKGVGMTVKGEKIDEKYRREEAFDILKKIKTRSERNFAKTLDCISVEEVVEYASKNKLLDICICGHAKMRHINLGFLKKRKSHNLEDGLEKCAEKDCACCEYKFDLLSKRELR